MAFSKVSTLVLVLLAFLDLSLAASSPQEFVAAHNKVRAKLNLPPVKWNATVAAYAEKYAKVRSSDCEIIHSEGPYGENLAEASWELTAAEAMKMWADDEEKYYNYKTNSCIDDQECGHYTQVVWRDSDNIGCATSKCNDGGTFVICSYYPEGNDDQERPY